jgi:hypothetical protein
VLDALADALYLLAQRLLRRVELLGDVVELERDADEALQQRVVDLAADPHALGQHEIVAAADAPQTQLPGRPRRQQDCGEQRQPERHGLIEGRLNRECERVAHLVPIAVAVAGGDAERVRPRRQVRVRGLAAFACVLPVGVEVLEAIAELRLTDGGEAQDRVVDLDA